MSNPTTEDPPVDPPIKDQPKTGLTLPGIIDTASEERSVTTHDGRFTIDIHISVRSE
jgi:hypothetical protein